MNSNTNSLLADLHLLKSKKNEYQINDYLLRLVEIRDQLIQEVKEVPITPTQNEILEKEILMLF